MTLCDYLKNRLDKKEQKSILEALENKKKVIDLKNKFFTIKKENVLIECYISGEYLITVYDLN